MNAEVLLLRLNLVLWVLFANFHYVMSKIVDNWVDKESYKNYIDFYILSLSAHTGSTSAFNFTSGKFIAFYHFFFVLFVNIMELADDKVRLTHNEVMKGLFKFK
tara:strand:- start:130 stop:441 length:312 start_codon:yes stop_codon:yes gene_type:complete